MSSAGGSLSSACGASQYNHSLRGDFTIDSYPGPDGVLGPAVFDVRVSSTYKADGELKPEARKAGGVAEAGEKFKREHYKGIQCTFVPLCVEQFGTQGEAAYAFLDTVAEAQAAKALGVDLESARQLPGFFSREGGGKQALQDGDFGGNREGAGQASNQGGGECAAKSSAGVWCS